MNNQRKYRMYGMVPYNISPIQQGIQFGHAVVEYGITYGNTEEYTRWSRYDKTFIILNGGTTNRNLHNPGTLNGVPAILEELSVRYETFHEPDLGDQLTATVFLVDDRIYDRENWPDYAGPYYSDGRTPVAEDFWNWKMKFDESEKIADTIVYLRTWLKGFRLA